VKIVPAILAEKFDDFTARLKEAESFADYVQIDVMDGIFVDTTSFPVERINGVTTSLSFEAHLMVNEPVSFMDRIDHPGLKKVIFHFEASAEFPFLIRKIRGRGLVPGLAVKPETGLDAFREIGEQVDTLLFLTVNPGFYGNSFRPEVLTKIAESRKVFPEKIIAVDGGVALDNLKTFLDVGVDYVCVGSRIFLNGDPGENYHRFLGRVKEIKKG
jgi:ribulose-phosphate 3-epimerase